MALGLLLAGVTNQAQAAFFPGQPLSGLVGWDGIGDATISLDEAGHISLTIGPGAFFGPYDVTTTHIASTVNPAWVDSLGNALEVTSYLVKGKSAIADIQLAAGVVGIVEPASDGGADPNDLSDALIFTPLGVDGAGFGLSRIDFLSDNENVFHMAFDKLVLEDASAQAVYLASSGYANGDNDEKVTYLIDSSAPDSVPDTGTTFGLFSLALTGLGLLRRKLA